ncbi:MAG: hypothetical protein COW67_07045 [Flavobacteriales bacterium CG18_big_fil_WC_8_21_14_2_50_32_9]|nr:MAG: hypothetical protein COW67_07045 [Flavobacteriales bacterium CG18_big_fil_WC_8_21_14_2_50_32_9]
MENQENNTTKETIPDNKELKFSFLRSFVLLIKYLKDVVNIRDGIDVEGSIDSIQKDIDFKGVNIWILGASIAIASIGLNVNSTAVIIGAMLISPLMGPIVGVGLAIGINNLNMLKRSLKSLGTAVFISVVVSTIYFLLTPFGEVQSELIARTRPTLLDVLIAVFGGVALIVARTKKGTIASTIYGVAIATALMPPLCTAGYGLANGNWSFFFGAFYLFIINSVFIILATWLIVKYLRFPLTSYIDKAKQKKVTRYIWIFTVIIILPSSFTFWRSIQESIFRSNAENFIIQNFEFEESEVIDKKINYTTEEGNPLIEVYLIGKPISGETKKMLNKKMLGYNLENTELKIYQSEDNTHEITSRLTSEVKSGIIEELYKKNQETIEDKDAKIKFLENEINKMGLNNIPFKSLSKEVKMQYEDVIGMEVGKTVYTNFSNKQDTSTTILVKWNPNIDSETRQAKKNSLQKWLRVRLDDDKLKVVSY